MHKGTRLRQAQEGLLLRSGVIAPVLFFVVFLIEGATRANYNALQHPVSSLEIGELGWMQRTNFVVSGGLIIAFAVGLKRRLGGLWRPLLIGLVGVGLIGAGVFAADPISGYPPGTPMIPDRTTEGKLHDALSSLVFLGLPVACFVFAKSGSRAWAVCSIASGVAFLVSFVLTSMGFAQQPTLMPIGGLLQRVTLLIGFGWVAALALRVTR
jgi:hypothetical protein